MTGNLTVARDSMVEPEASARPVENVITLIERYSAAQPIPRTAISHDEGDRVTRAAGSDDETPAGPGYVPAG